MPPPFTKNQKFEEMLELHKADSSFIKSLPPTEKLAFGRYLQDRERSNFGK